jgi:hypothetical protein
MSDRRSITRIFAKSDTSFHSISAADPSRRAIGEERQENFSLITGAGRNFNLHENRLRMAHRAVKRAHWFSQPHKLSPSARTIDSKHLLTFHSPTSLAGSPTASGCSAVIVLVRQNRSFAQAGPNTA